MIYYEYLCNDCPKKSNKYLNINIVCCTVDNKYNSDTRESYIIY